MSKTQKNILKKNQFEKSAWLLNNTICGIDEAGRGSFAGPVVAAAVSLPHKKAPNFLKDSKIMSPSQRESAFSWIIAHCTFGIGIVNHRVIEEKNIVHATKYAMKRAILEVQSKHKNNISAILVDAVRLDIKDIGLTIPLYAFAHGETYSSSIAAASIVAKVTRDRLMQSLHNVFPAYYFENHKGYGTKLHQAAIKEHGISIIHRKSYCKSSIK